MSITLTESAIKELDRIMLEQNLSKNTCLRLGVRGGGCSGFSYILEFDDTVNEVDQVNEYGGITVVCDPKSFLYLSGMSVNFENTLMNRGFKFINPNAVKSCGCGESFSA